MVRPFAVKGRKRKQKEKYDKDSEEEQEQKHLKVDAEELAADNHDEQPEDSEGKVADALEGIPIVPVEKKSGRDSGIIFVLEKASLELAKVGKNYQLLNSDDHANFLKKNGKNPAEYRPDIVHQALLSILDSPLNKAGKVRAVYMKTEKGVLIEVKPHVRLPRTYKRFAGIMMQLLQTLSISASGKREKLLRVIKNPVTQYLPVNARKVGFSSKGKLVEMQDYVASIDNDTPLVFVKLMPTVTFDLPSMLPSRHFVGSSPKKMTTSAQVGAMAHGKIDDEYADDFLAISNYPLSAACCINIICEAVRRHLKFI